MAALKLAALPSSVAAYRALFRNAPANPLPRAKCVLSGSRWDSEVFIALHALVEEESPGFIHPTIRVFYKAAFASIQQDQTVFNGLGAFSAGQSLLVPGYVLAANPVASPFSAFYRLLGKCLEPARVAQSATTAVRSRPPPRTSTLSPPVAAPTFIDYDDGLDVDVVMGEDEDDDHAFDPVLPAATPGTPTHNQEILIHMMAHNFVSEAHSNHERFLRNQGAFDPNDDQFEYSPEADRHKFTLRFPAMSSNIEDDGGPDVYEFDGVGNFVKNPDRSRPVSCESKSGVTSAIPQHLAEGLKLFQQRTMEHGITTAADLDGLPPSFFQILLFSGQSKYMGLVVCVVPKLWYQRRFFDFHPTPVNPNARGEYATVHYDYPFDFSLVHGRRQIAAMHKAALDWYKHHSKVWHALRPRVSRS